MAKVIFNSIHIEGFRSMVKPFRFQFHQPGIVLVRGRNGAGKTTAFEGLVWALFGTNLKDTVQAKLASWGEVRQTNWQGTRVCLSMLVDGQAYTVARHLDYKGDTFGVKGGDSLLVVKSDGKSEEMIGDFRNKGLTQEFINKLIGVDANTFMNSIMFGQRMAKLVEQDNGDKRKLFETLFETEWVNQAKTICDEKLKKASAQLLLTDSNIISIGQIIEEKKVSLTTAELFLQGFETSRKSRLTAKEEIRKTHVEASRKAVAEFKRLEALRDALGYNSAKHDELEAAHAALEAKLTEANTAVVKKTSAVSLAKSVVTGKEAAVTTAQAQLDKLKAKHIEEECPYCAQKLLSGNKLEVNHNADIKAAEDVLKAAKAAVEAAKTELKKAEDVVVEQPTSIGIEVTAAFDKLVVMDALYDQWAGYDNQMTIQQTINTSESKDIVRLDKEIADIKAEGAPAMDIPGMKKAIEDEEAALIKLQELQPKYKKEVEIATWWSSKGLSSGGIKAFIFKAMLSQLNENVKKYGQRLGASLEFSIDLTKASKPFTTICSLGDKLNKDYTEFSGGEKQRLDLCLMFAMYDLISMGTNINLLIMDEALENLDEEGEAAAFDIIRQMAADGKIVYIITHSATIDNLLCTSIMVEKDGSGNTIFN